MRFCEHCECPITRTPGSRTDRLRFCNQSCVTAWTNKRRSKSVVSRFWAYVNKTATCWLWTGPMRPNGYGRITLENGRTAPGAHRVSWDLHNGRIPEGLFVCHKCDIRNCVNPDHLFLGTQLDNMRDRRAKGR